MTPVASTAMKRFSRPAGIGSSARATAANGAIVNVLVLISPWPLLNVKSARLADTAYRTTATIDFAFSHSYIAQDFS